MRSTPAWAVARLSPNSTLRKAQQVKPITSAGPAKAPPTRKQLAYLRSLANRSATTFTYPRTSAQASAEIKRLQRLEQSSQPTAPASSAPCNATSPNAPTTPPGSAATSCAATDPARAGPATHPRTGHEHRR